MADQVAKFAADFESCFSKKKLSDVTLVLREEDRRERELYSVVVKTGSTGVITLPGHSMVLLAYSGFCKTKVRAYPVLYSVLSTTVVQPVHYRLHSS